MRKFVLAALTLFISAGLTLAAQLFVSYKDDTITVKDGDKEVKFKVTDKTAFKAGKDAKDVPADKAKEFLGKLKEGAEIKVEGSKDTAETVTFMKGKKKDK